MISLQEAITANQPLVDRYINLVFCRDNLLDSTHRWFYSCFTPETLTRLHYLTSEEDFRQDLYLAIIELATPYQRSLRSFNDILRLDLGRIVRDKVQVLLTYYRFIQACKIILPGVYIDFPKPRLSLHWVLSDEKTPLTTYQRYLLFLYLFKEFSIKEIAGITYRDRCTTGDEVFAAITVLKDYWDSSDGKVSGATSGK